MHLVLALLGALRAGLGARTDLVLENLALRQQLALLRRRSKRPRFGPLDRLFWIWLLCLLKSPSADPCATRVGSTCAPAGGLAAGRCDLLPPVRSATQTGMFALLRAFAAAVRTLFCSRADLVLENLALRQQLAILARRRPRRRLCALDRAFWVGLA